MNSSLSFLALVQAACPVQPFQPYPCQHFWFLTHPSASNMPTLSKSGIEIWRPQVVSSFKWWHAFLLRSNLHNPHWAMRGKEAGRTSPTPRLQSPNQASCLLLLPTQEALSSCSYWSFAVSSTCSPIEPGSMGIGNPALFDVRGRNQWWIKTWRCRRSLP